MDDGNVGPTITYRDPKLDQGPTGLYMLPSGCVRTLTAGEAEALGATPHNPETNPETTDAKPAPKKRRGRPRKNPEE